MNDWFKNIGQLDRPITIFPLAVRAFGGHAEAAFVSQLRFWMPHSKDPDSWVYKTQDDLESELCLTPRQQEHVREKLKELGVLETYYEREEHMLYYRLSSERFNELMEAAEAFPKNVGATEHSQKTCQPFPKNVGGIPKKRSSFNTEITSETTSEITSVTSASEPEEPKTITDRDIAGLWKLMRWSYKKLTAKSLGSGLRGNPGDRFRELAIAHGQDKVLAGFEAFIAHQGKDNLRKFNNPIFLFLKQAEEWIDDASIEPEESKPEKVAGPRGVGSKYADL